MKILLFIGAGGSTELRIPAMREMVEKLHDHLKFKLASIQFIEQFEEYMRDADNDLEDFIELVYSIENGEVAKKKIGANYNQSLLDSAQQLRWETEWFTQQICDRVELNAARALWGPILRQLNGHELCVVTTNYDCSFEVAAKSYEIEIDDGFMKFSDKEYVNWIGFQDGKSPKLLKIHGSIDWYRGQSDDVFKLRHSIPIFGDLTISFRNENNIVLSSAIVLPTREKVTTFPPFPELGAEFRKISQLADLAVFVGTSFRDPEVKDIFHQCANEIQTIVVGCNDQPFDLQIGDKSIYVQQTASNFLAVTLPSVLCGELTQEMLSENHDDGKEVVPILDHLVNIGDTDSDPTTICNSIEFLTNHRISVDIELIKSLIDHNDTRVRTFSLALIPNSYQKDAAIQFASDIGNNIGDDTFKNEVEYLNKLVKDGRL